MSGPFTGRDVRRIVRRFAERLADGDVDALVELDGIVDEAQAALVAAVEQLRSEPWNYSWTEIGTRLGMSKQAAAQYYGPRISPRGARRPGGQPLHLR